MAKKTKKEKEIEMWSDEGNRIQATLDKREQAINEIIFKSNESLELGKANAKAIQDLNDKIQKSFLEYSNTLMLLKERNRLR